MPLEDYSHPVLTVDVVLFTLRDGDLQVLLIQREKLPFEGCWAFPGGFVEVGEPLQEAALRELAEETGIRDVYLEQLWAFGDPGRDPRGHVVTVAYLALLSADAVTDVRAGSDAARARWWSIHDLPSLAFDHAEILVHALRRLRSKLRDATLGTTVLPAGFNVGELQAACEAFSEGDPGEEPPS